MSGAAAQLATSAAAKLQHGFRPSTLRQYHRIWTDFLAFQVAAGLPLKVTVEILLSFLEYLHQNTITSAHMQNYLAALRSLHILHGLDTSPFRDQRLAFTLKPHSYKPHLPQNESTSWIFMCWNKLSNSVISSNFQLFLKHCTCYFSSPS